MTNVCNLLSSLSILSIAIKNYAALQDQMIRIAVTADELNELKHYFKEKEQGFWTVTLETKNSIECQWGKTYMKGCPLILIYNRDEF